MATPKGAITGAVQPILIGASGNASPPNQLMGNVDTVQYQNGNSVTNATVKFLGAGKYAFGNNNSSVTVPSNNGKSGQLPPQLAWNNCTVNYAVTLGVTQSPTFSIQIGTGPLEIDITDTAGTTNIPASAIGNNGTLFFKNLTAEKATLNFGGDQVLYDSNGNLVTSQVVNANSSGAVLTGRGTNKNVTYTVAMSAAAYGDVRGGSGSIKVGH